MPELPERIRSVIESIAEIRGARPVRALQGGAASDHWLLDRDGQRLVLRIDRPLASALGLARQAEIDILRLVGEAGIGPRPVWSDPAHGILVSTWLPGSSWSVNDVRDPGHLRQLAKTLQILHQLPVRAREFDPVSAAQRYAVDPADERAFALSEQAIALASELDSDTATKVLCHNDLVHSNIIGLQPVPLIDWEYAAMGDPLFDLAIVIRHHELPEALAEVFLNAYSADSNPVDRMLLDRFCRLYDLMAALWYQTMLRQAEGPSPFREELSRVLVRLGEQTPEAAVRPKS